MRRSSSVVPPHTPSVTALSSAQARHWICAGQLRQARLACSIWRSAAPAVPTGKNRSGSASRQAASSRQLARTVIAAVLLAPLGSLHARIGPGMVSKHHPVYVILPTVTLKTAAPCQTLQLAAGLPSAPTCRRVSPEMHDDNDLAMIDGLATLSSAVGTVLDFIEAFPSWLCFAER